MVAVFAPSRLRVRSRFTRSREAAKSRWEKDNSHPYWFPPKPMKYGCRTRESPIRGRDLLIDQVKECMRLRLRAKSIYQSRNPRCCTLGSWSATRSLRSNWNHSQDGCFIRHINIKFVKLTNHLLTEDQWLVPRMNYHATNITTKITKLTKDAQSA